VEAVKTTKPITSGREPGADSLPVAVEAGDLESDKDNFLVLKYTAG